MSILINKDTKVITQGITGKTASSTRAPAVNMQTAAKRSSRA